jgi:hypothetical protein
MQVAHFEIDVNQPWSSMPAWRLMGIRMRISGAFLDSACRIKAAKVMALFSGRAADAYGEPRSRSR